MKKVMILVLATMLLAGCGVKGGLYFPAESPKNEQAQ